MFHSSHIHIPRTRQPSALRTFVTSSSFGPTETKEPLRRGILFTTVASVLLLVGGILTWLGFNDVFGGKVSMTGPLLIALALLLLLLSMRQFLIARKRNNTTRNGLQLGQMGHGTVTAVVVDRNDGMGAVTVIMDGVNVDHEPQVRNYASSSGDDYAPPSYNEVAQWSGSDLPSGGPLPDHDEPPPPYEEAVCSGATSASSRNIAETCASQYADGSSVPGQVSSSSSYYHSRMFPVSSCPEGSHSPSLNSADLSAVDITHSSSRPWWVAKRFLLIPDFLGVLAQSRPDLAGSQLQPPAYQAVDTTGCSPVPYVQAVGMDSLLVPGNENLGVQSPHESRTIVAEERVDTDERAEDRAGVESSGNRPSSSEPVQCSSGHVASSTQSSGDASDNTTVSYHSSPSPVCFGPTGGGHHTSIGIQGSLAAASHHSPSHPGTTHHPGNRHPSHASISSNMAAERTANPATPLFLPRANCSIINELEEVV